MMAIYLFIMELIRIVHRKQKQEKSNYSFSTQNNLSSTWQSK